MALKIKNGDTIAWLEDVWSFVGGKRHLRLVDTLSLFFPNAEVIHRASRIGAAVIDEIDHVFLFLFLSGMSERKMK